MCQLLLESGFRVVCHFYGGAGGGKKKKSSLLEIGHVIDVSFKSSTKSLNVDFLTAAEFSLVWRYEKIRTNFEAYYLLCFMSELLMVVTQQSSESDEFQDHFFREIFTVASNSIFYLEDSLTKEQFSKHASLNLFLAKLFVALGVFPDLDSCLYCQNDLKQIRQFELMPNEGGFVCRDCLVQKGQDGGMHAYDWELAQSVHLFLTAASRTLYKNYQELPQNSHAGSSNRLPKKLMAYLCFQFQLNMNQFKTLSMVL